MRMSVSGPTLRVPMHGAAWHVSRLVGWFFWFGIQNWDCNWIMYHEAWRFSRRWRNSEAKQTDRHTTALSVPLLHHVPSGFIYFLILSLGFFLFLSSVLFCLFTTVLYLSFFHSINPFSLSLCIFVSCRFFFPHLYFPTVSLLFPFVSNQTLHFASLARPEYF